MPSGAEADPGPTCPAISVVVCAFAPERIELLAKAVAALASQTVPAGEVILVVDHSPPLAAECERRWPELRVVANRERQGLSGARNTGLAASGGEVVAFLDDDAVPAPDWLERLGRAYADPRVLGAGGAVRPVWAEGRPGWFPEELDWVVGCTHSGMPRERAAVRNLVGANMSFRREALLAAGAFRHELGRIGTIPAGCEETDLCIRIGAGRPDGAILYDPEAAVDHFVPAVRARFRYLVSRCRGEGRSKAVLSALVGSAPGLSAERSYVRRTLPAGFLRGVREALRGDPAGAARAAALVAGLAATTAGYLGGRRPARQLARRRERAAAGGGALRVLVVTPRSPLAQGGVERHVAEVSRRLAAAGAEVEVLCTEPGGPALRERRLDGVTVRTVRAWPAHRDWCFAPRLWTEMGRRPWDVVHVQSYHTLVAPLAMLRALTLGIPYVVTFHGGGHSSRLRNGLRRLQRRLLRPLLARAARLVAVARFEIGAYGGELRLPPDRFALIPNGVDLAFAAADLPPAEPDGQPLIASIGRLERYKGHHRAIAALPHVLAREPGARLAIVGAGPYEAELRRQAAALGVGERVELTSVPANEPAAMAALLRRVSLVVLLSDFETHPLAALEAAAARRRLLVADRGGLAELAEQGFARAVAPEEAPQAIAAAIVEELALPQPRDVPPLTSWDECAEALLELYGEVADQTNVQG